MIFQPVIVRLRQIDRVRCTVIQPKENIYRLGEKTDPVDKIQSLSTEGFWLFLFSYMSKTNRELEIYPEKILAEIVKFYLEGKEILINYRPDWLKNPKTGYNLELDVYVPELNMAWEMQGMHHKTMRQEEKDEIKRKVCAERGIELNEVWKITSLFSVIRKLIQISPRKFILPRFRKAIYISEDHYKKLLQKALEWKKRGSKVKPRHMYFKRNDYIIRMEKGAREQKAEREFIKKVRELKALRQAIK